MADNNPKNIQIVTQGLTDFCKTPAQKLSYHENKIYLVDVVPGQKNFMLWPRYTVAKIFYYLVLTGKFY